MGTLKNKKNKYGKMDVAEYVFKPEQTKIKVTAWFDADVILALKTKADREGSKYQTLMNHLLKKAISETDSIEVRLERLEKKMLKIG